MAAIPVDFFGELTADAVVAEPTTAYDRALAVVTKALAGVPTTTSVAEVNRLLRLVPDGWWKADPPFCSYSTWRRVVRAAQTERAKWLEWECDKGRRCSRASAYSKGDPEMTQDEFDAHWTGVWNAQPEEWRAYHRDHAHRSRWAVYLGLVICFEVGVFVGMLLL